LAGAWQARRSQIPVRACRFFESDRMTLDEIMQRIDEIMRDSLAELFSIAEPTEAEIAELERWQAAERARVERELRAWLDRDGETQQ
jgi:hypothetical protein